MGKLTEQQQWTLDRISETSGDHVKVVGWADGGPVLRVRNKRLVVIHPNGKLLEVSNA